MKQRNRRRTYKQRGGINYGLKCVQDGTDNTLSECTMLKKVGETIELRDIGGNFCKAIKLKILAIKAPSNPEENDCIRQINNILKDLEKIDSAEINEINSRIDEYTKYIRENKEEISEDEKAITAYNNT